MKSAFEYSPILLALYKFTIIIFYRIFYLTCSGSLSCERSLLVEEKLDSGDSFVKTVQCLLSLRSRLRYRCFFCEEISKIFAYFFLKALYGNNQINTRALIGQSALVYCARKLMEKSRVF